MGGQIKVRRTKLQNYTRNYCLVCISGLLGCRWHRYKQSSSDSTKCNLFCFFFSILTFLYVVCNFYFWLVTKNSFTDFNWYMFGAFKKWIPWYTIAVVLISCTFIYCIIVIFLYLCHVIHGKQLYMHPVHMVVITLCFVGCVAASAAVDAIWSTEWTTLISSLRVFGPFLQVGTIIIMTAVSWIISQQWLRLSHRWMKILWMVIYVIIMSGLYLSPLCIKSPCITFSTNIPKKPKLLAHKGATSVYPENTILAFQYALENNVWGIESDVHISNDCVPFIMHDNSLLRTTNVADIFPDRAENHASTFNISEVKSLDAGTWFLRTDPYGTAGDLTSLERILVANQTVPTLQQVAAMIRNASDVHFMFDLRIPPTNHPCYELTVNLTIAALQNAGLPLKRVLWLEGTFNNSRPPGVTLVNPKYVPVESLRKLNISMTNTGYSKITDDNIFEYRSANISTNIWTVNSPWFYSFFWCLEVSSVATDNCHILNKMTAPILQLTQSSYLIMWVTIDVISAVCILAIFIIQRFRHQGKSFSPGSILNSAAQRVQERTYISSLMKEDLLYNMDEGVQGKQLSGHNRMITMETGLDYSMYSIPANSETSIQNTF